jgi:hypothetical protein
MLARSRKILAAVMVSTGLMAPVVLAAAPAQASYEQGCVGYYEYFEDASTTYTWERTHRILGTTGRLLDRDRAGYRGRLLDVYRQYRSCGYAEDDIVLNFDDYSAPGNRRYGGYLRLYSGLWTHYCVDQEELYDEDGYNYGFYCYDAYWEGEYYYDEDGEFAPRAGAEAGVAAKVTKQGDQRVITRDLSPRAAK